MIKGLSQHCELNKQLGFVVGDLTLPSLRLPIRLIQHSAADAPVYLLKLDNLQFVSPPIPGYEVRAYLSDSNTHTDSDSDVDSTSSSESSLPDTLHAISAIDLSHRDTVTSEAALTVPKH